MRKFVFVALIAISLATVSSCNTSCPKEEVKNDSLTTMVDSAKVDSLKTDTTKTVLAPVKK